ncbi:MAG: S9 family peptidase [Thermoanaerobaculia bacterium]|nr:S9 family peptidase [Thermoanaerobaculia bacterium]
MANDATSTRGLTADDLVRMKRLSDPQPSPDGGWIVYVLRTTDMEADRGRTDLWLVDTAGEVEPRQLTTHPASDSTPRWAPDGGSIYFLSSRGGSSQVWRLPTTGGEAVQTTDLPLDVSGFSLSPDGKHLALSVDVFIDCETLQCTAERLEQQSVSKRTGQIYDRLFVRHWDTWKDGRRSHLFVIPLHGEDGPSSENRQPIDVTRGLDADVPTKPWGGFEEVAWTPSGRGLVFTARVAGREEPWSTNFDLWYAPRDGTSAPARLTTNPAWDTQPSFSPDGRHLAYLAMARPGFEADQFELLLRPWTENEQGVELGSEIDLTGDWDRSVGGYFFADDFAAGKGTLYVTAGDRGNVRLFALDASSRTLHELWGKGHVRSAARVGYRLIFGLDTLTHPVDLFSVALDGSDLRRLTDVNAAGLEKIEMGEYEQFSFPGWNDETVYGYLVKPAGFESGKRYPVAFLIHGGPQGSFDNDFHYRWNPQTYAGAGYAVVTIDFHGSTGYGQAFVDSIREHWGDRPLEDLQKGWKHALETWDFLDGDSACALGASYGGYMINWIAGNWPDGFDCLVNHDGLFDMRHMYYSTEELWFPEWEMGGKPYFVTPEAYERFNPVHHVDKWKTPMLVIHGALDYRVVDTEGLGTFTALQRRGIPSKLLFYPDENHWVLSPTNSIQWHEVVLDWLEQWTTTN